MNEIDVLMEVITRATEKGSKFGKVMSVREFKAIKVATAALIDRNHMLQIEELKNMSATTTG